MRPAILRDAVRARPSGEAEEEVNGGTRMTRLLRWLEWPIRSSLWIALLAGLLMMLHVSADVTGRYLFIARSTAPPRSWPPITWCMVAYLPWAYLARNDNHIVSTSSRG